MSDLISREAVLEFEEYVGERATWDKPYPKGDLYVKSEIIERIPSVEPEIIHCRECVYGKQDYDGWWYCRSFGCQVGDEDGSGFCSNAERENNV